MQTAEQRGRAANMVPRWVLIVEGATQEAVDQVLSTRLSPTVFGDMGVTEVLHGIYSLQHDLLAAC
jgi:hypothetical protein